MTHIRSSPERLHWRTIARWHQAESDLQRILLPVPFFYKEFSCEELKVPNENDPKLDSTTLMTAENWEPWGVAETPQISDMAKSLVREYLKIALDLNPIWSIDQFPESEELGYVTFQIYGNDSRTSRQAVWKMMVAAQESNVTRPRMVLGVFQ